MQRHKACFILPLCIDYQVHDTIQNRDFIMRKPKTFNMIRELFSLTYILFETWTEVGKNAEFTFSDFIFTQCESVCCQ